VRTESNSLAPSPAGMIRQAWRSLPEVDSDPTKSFRPWAQAVWARSGALAIGSSIATLQSRSSPTSSPTTSNASRVFSVKRGPLPPLNHRHIAAIYGFEERDGVTALVMELIEVRTSLSALPAVRSHSTKRCRAK
jgi:hypothetical protein